MYDSEARSTYARRDLDTLTRGSPLETVIALVTSSYIYTRLNKMYVQVSEAVLVLGGEAVPVCMFCISPEGLGVTV